MRSRKNRRFTLIELLLVVTIIMILLMMLKSSYYLVMRMAGKSQCQGNLRQMGLSLQAYIDNYDHWVPPFSETGASSSLTAAPIKARWGYKLWLFHKSYPLYKCPQDTQSFRVNNFERFPQYAMNEPCYGYNSTYCGEAPNVGGYRKISFFTAPAYQMMVGDSSYYRLSQTLPSYLLQERHDGVGSVVRLDNSLVTLRRVDANKAPNVWKPETWGVND